MDAAASPSYAAGLWAFDAPGTLMHFNVSSKASQLTEPEKPESKSERTGTKLSAFCSPWSHSTPVHSTNKPLPVNITYGPELKHQADYRIYVQNRDPNWDGTTGPTQWHPGKPSRPKHAWKPRWCAAAVRFLKLSSFAKKQPCNACVSKTKQKISSQRPLLAAKK